MLEFNVRNQELNRIDNFLPTEKSVSYLVAKFNFKTEDWNDTKKIAVFKNLKTKKEIDRKLEENICIIPSEALDESGRFEVSVYGVKEDYKITSSVATCNLNRTLSGGSMAAEDTLNAAERLLLEAQNKLDKSGHEPNKYLGTDAEGNVVAKSGSAGSGNVTEEEKEQWNGYQSHIYNLQMNKADRSEIPIKTSDLDNDSGFITEDDLPNIEIPDVDLTDYATKEYVDNYSVVLSHDGNGNATIEGLVVLVDGNEVAY